MKRKRYMPETKVSILKEHFEQNVSIADICEKHRIHPNQFYRWKKELFENAPEIFSTKRSKRQQDDKTAALEKIIKDRNEVIAELLQENLQLKKLSGEI